jgi:hypothetical protein
VKKYYANRHNIMSVGFLISRKGENMKCFLVGTLLFLAGCGNAGNPTLPSYTSADRSRDSETNSLVWWILFLVSLLVVKVLWDQFRSLGNSEERETRVERESQDAPDNPPPPPSNSLEEEEDRP